MERRYTVAMHVHYVVAAVAFVMPLLIFAAASSPTTNARAISPGPNQMKLCGSLKGCGNFTADLNVTFYTPELSHFNDRMCSDGPCRNSILGLAHRSWPMNSCVAVCNLQNNICAEAIIMDRGPNERLTRRTIDANPALRVALKMSDGLVPATYQLISLPGTPCKNANVEALKYGVKSIDPYTVPGAPGTPGAGTPTPPTPQQTPTPQYSPQAGTAQPGQYFGASNPAVLSSPLSQQSPTLTSTGSNPSNNTNAPNLGSYLLDLIRPVFTGTTTPRIIITNPVITSTSTSLNDTRVIITPVVTNGTTYTVPQTFIGQYMPESRPASQQAQNSNQGVVTLLETLKGALLRLGEWLRLR